MTGSLVSILIPAYNAEKWIGDTISSALNQTWPKKEIIIVDDESTDGTLQIARRFESKSVKVITQKNGGAPAARNKALSFAQGDYIQWLDADDLLAPDKISQQLKGNDSGQDTRTLLSAATGRFYYNPDKARFIPNSLWQDLEPIDWLMVKLTENVWIGLHAWLISRKLTELAGNWDERLSNDDDGEYSSRVVAASDIVKFIPEAKCYYRKGNTGSVSWGVSDRASQSLFLATQLTINHLRSLEDNGMTRAACLKFLQSRLVSFYPDKYELVKEANKIAQELGGELSPPKEGWKFCLTRKIFGRRIAKNFKNILWKVEILTRRNYDRLFHI